MYLSISRLGILFFVSKTATNICSHDDILNSSNIIQKDESKKKKGHWSVTLICLSEKVSDYCLTPTQQFFSYITARAS
jgi:hypothetical protein